MEKNYNIISGPCSVESLEQFTETVKGLINNGVTDIRGGVWKPRTSAGQFEGLGEEALEIISEVKKLYNFTSYVEVANREQVELAERYNIDALWLGARTTGSPFAVQEIAEAIKDKSKHILIKNPINDDVNLWVGAYSRFKALGFTNISLIFRGFDSHSVYRYNPRFEAIKEFYSKAPDWPPVYIDISHIAGDRKLLGEISSKAITLGYENFFIESHIDPSNALTDSKQQIKPDELLSVLNTDLLLKYERRAIDNIDDHIIRLINERLKIAERIGVYKKANNLLVLDPDRYIEVLTKYGDLKEVFKTIHLISCDKQLSI